jgi:hypothetical protein
MGLTTESRDPSYETFVPCAIVEISNAIPDDTLTQRAILWHEYCHAEQWLATAELSDHGADWLKLLMRKPALALWDRCVCPFLWGLVYQRRRQ